MRQVLILKKKLRNRKRVINLRTVLKPLKSSSKIQTPSWRLMLLHQTKKPWIEDEPRDHFSVLCVRASLDPKWFFSSGSKHQSLPLDKYILANSFPLFRLF